MGMKELHEHIWDAYCEAFEDQTCTKFCGAFTAEELRRRLQQQGLPVSRQDVFIRNVPIQLDLLIPKPNTRAKLHNLIYEPEDVLAVLEIKYRGTFSGDAVEVIRNNFRRIRQANRQVSCVYVTVTETLGYTYAITRRNLGFPAYTLYWYTRGEHKRTDDWEKLVAQLRRKVAGSLR